MGDSSNISADLRQCEQSESILHSSKVPNTIASAPGEEQQKRAVVPKMKLKQTEVAKKIMAHKPAVTLLKNPSTSPIPSKTIVMNPSILNPTQPNERIRSKFFTRIGIDAPTAAATLSLNGPSSEPSALMSSAPPRPHPREEHINLSQEALKYDVQEEELIEAQLQNYRRRHQQMLNGNKENGAENDNSDKGKKERKKINFSHTVTVLPVSFFETHHINERAIGNMLCRLYRLPLLIFHFFLFLTPRFQ